MVVTAVALAGALGAALFIAAPFGEGPGLAGPPDGGRAGARPADGAPPASGSEACGACHPAESARWRGSQHARAHRLPSDPTVRASFAGEALRTRGATWTFVTGDRGPRARVEEPGRSAFEHELALIIGVAPLEQPVVAGPGGVLRALPVAWDVSRGQWFDLYPGEAIGRGDALHFEGRSAVWNHMCVRCHATGVRKGVLDSGYRTTWSELAVGCEACHGPGLAHVALRTTTGVAEMGAADTDARVNAADPLVARATDGLEPCLRCHARAVAVTEPAEGARFLDSFVPELLDSGVLHADGQPRHGEEVFEYSTFAQSTKFARGVVCTACHEPHSGALRAAGNLVCAPCHLPERYDTRGHHRHAAGTHAARCVSCHMREERFMVVDGRRDHGFRIPRPAPAGVPVLPSPCADCHADRDAAWIAAELAGWPRPTDVRPVAGTAGPGGWAPPRSPGDPEAVAAIAKGRAGDPEAVPALLALASDGAASDVLRASALALVARVVPRPPRAGPDTDASRVVDAVARASASTSPLVARAAWLALAELAARGLLAEARARVLAPPRAVGATVRHAWARAAARVGPQWVPPSRALTEATAAALAAGPDEDQPEPHHDRAVLLEDLGRAGEAAAEYRRAIALDGTYLPPRFNLVRLLASVGDGAAAEREARALVEAAPGDQAAQETLARLLAALGRPAAPRPP